MNDYAHEQTDKMLDELEESIRSVYSTVSEEIQQKMEGFLNNFEKQDKEKLKQVKDGIITEQEYQRWRLQIVQKAQEYTQVVQKSAEIAYNTNRTAQQIVNDKLPQIYALNQSYMHYVIEQGALLGNFSLGFVDELTIIRLLRDNPELFPVYKLIKKEDIQYNIKKIREVIASGLLQGKPMQDIARDLERIAKMNQNSAILHARTAVTGAENAGRQAGIKNAEQKGIQLKRKWISTLDKRTRVSHQYLDGQLREVDEPFDSPLGEIMYPGDTNAKPANVWNCRCSLGVQIDGVTKQGQRRARQESGKNEVIKYKTYKEWQEAQ